VVGTQVVNAAKYREAVVRTFGGEGPPFNVRVAAEHRERDRELVRLARRAKRRLAVVSYRERDAVALDREDRERVHGFDEVSTELLRFGHRRRERLP